MVVQRATVLMRVTLVDNLSQAAENVDKKSPDAKDVY